MRVKVILAMTIATVLLLCSVGLAFAANPGCGSGCDCGSACQCGTDCNCNVANPNAVCNCAGNNAIPTTITGVPTADQLTQSANDEINCFGFPDLSAVEAVDNVGVPLDTVEAVDLTSPLCGVCGTIPACTCAETTTVIPGPAVNLGCPLVTVFPVPVNLVSPAITPVFPAINVAPQVCLGLPQVNTQLNCFDIACQPVTNINACPVC